MLLKKLEEHRKENPIEDVETEALRSPFVLSTAVPKRRPIVVDKIRLMEIGLNEIQAELLLCVWEAGGQLAIWGGEDTNLVHELGVTSRTIKHQAKRLVELGVLSYATQAKRDLTAQSPKRIAEIVDRSISARAKAFKDFAAVKELEYRKGRRTVQKFGVSYIDLIPTSHWILREAERKAERLVEYKNRDGEARILCGFVVGDFVAKNTLKVQDFVEVTTRSGPKIHFMPVWKDFHSTKRRLVSEGKLVVGEFHTHPNSDSTPHKEDIRKMESLQWGLWFIVCKDTIACYRFHRVKGNLRIDGIPKKTTGNRMADCNARKR